MQNFSKYIIEKSYGWPLEGDVKEEDKKDILDSLNYLNKITEDANFVLGSKLAPPLTRETLPAFQVGLMKAIATKYPNAPDQFGEFMVNLKSNSGEGPNINSVFNTFSSLKDQEDKKEALVRLLRENPILAAAFDKQVKLGVDFGVAQDKKNVEHLDENVNHIWVICNFRIFRFIL